MNVNKFLEENGHIGSFISISDCEKLMKQYHRHKLKDKMPSDGIIQIESGFQINGEDWKKGAMWLKSQILEHKFY